MLLKLFLFFCSSDAFDGNCTKYEHFVELDGIEIANTDDLGIFRIETDRSECAQKCLQTDTCLGLFQFCSLPLEGHLLSSSSEHMETKKAYSFNVEQKLCFLKGDSVGQKTNTKYVSGYQPHFEDLESEQFCAIAGNQDPLRAATCGILPSCDDKECEFGFKKNENHCQVSCDCVEDDENFLMGDIIIREEVKPFVLKKIQVIIQVIFIFAYRTFQRSGGAQAFINFWDNIPQNNKYIIPYTISESLRTVFISA